MNSILTSQEKAIRIISHFILALMCVLAVIPFWLLLSASLSDSNYAIREGYKFFPKELSFDAYKYILARWEQVGRAYGVTITVSICGTALSLLITSLLAYGLSQRNLPGANIITALILFTMLFSGGIVPQYLIYNNYLHVKNTLWGLILPNLLTNGFTVILVRNYFRTSIPYELTEAMEMDGAGPVRIYMQLILPLSKPILATIGIMSFVSYWNDWTNGLYYITDSKLYSVQQLLNEMNNNLNFLSNNASQLVGVDTSALPTATMRMAIAAVAIIPVLIAYPFFQRYFTKGIVLGAVKG